MLLSVRGGQSCVVQGLVVAGAGRCGRLPEVGHFARTIEELDVTVGAERYLTVVEAFLRFIIKGVILGRANFGILGRFPESLCFSFH